MVALNLEVNEEGYKLVEKIAALRGETVAEAIVELAREELERQNHSRQNDLDPPLVDRWMKITDGLKGHWSDPRSSSELFDDLYDDRGLPR